MTAKWIGALAAALGLTLAAGAAFAAPVTWNVSGTLSDGGTLSGSFVFDPDTNAYSAINITTTAGTLPGATYTVLHPAATSTILVANTAAGSAAGQPVIALSIAPGLSAAPGPRTLGNREGACNAGCSNFEGVDRSLTGTATASSPAPVPTLSQWAMILFAMVLAGGTALFLHRRRTAV